MGVHASHNKDENHKIFPIEELPAELLIHILKFVSAKDLVLNLSLVCKKWNEVLTSRSLWIEKCNYDKVPLPKVGTYEKLSTKSFMEFCTWRPFYRNLLTNWNAEGGLKNWTIVENGGNGFLVEKDTPPGAESLLNITKCYVNKCWATSYAWCTKRQVVDIWNQGCSSNVLDQIQPNIEVSEWIASRSDCGTKYELHVELLAKDKKTVISRWRTQHSEDQWMGKAWTEVHHVFSNYGPGVKYVQFTHRGKDKQFWAGHYGSKMAAPCVMLTFDSQMQDS